MNVLHTTDAPAESCAAPATRDRAPPDPGPATPAMRGFLARLREGVSARRPPGVAPAPMAWPPVEARAHGGRRGEPAGRLLRSTCAMVLAGGRGTRLAPLSDRCAKPALPFAGNLRIIDFTLSNCIHSGIRRIGVLTQYKSQRLIRHIAQNWSFLEPSLGEFIDMMPAQQQTGDGWYGGTADAVFQNLEMLRDAGPACVLVLAGDHVYRMDYGALVAEHARRGADVTIACIEAPLAAASAFGVVSVDDDGCVTGFDEKPTQPCAVPGRTDCALVSMGVYAFDAEFLYRELERDAADARSSHDFGRDIIPAALGRGRICAHDYASSCVGTEADDGPYWRDVGTLDAYWEAHMDLLRTPPALDLYDERWPILGMRDPLPPAKLAFEGGADPCGSATASLVAGGCVVSGATVRRSVLSARSRVGAGSLVEDSVLLPGAVVGRQAVVRRAIVDEGCVLPDGIRIGVCPAEDSARFCVTGQGLVVVTASMLTAAPLVGRAA